MEYTDEYDIFSPQGSEENVGSNEMYTIKLYKEPCDNFHSKTGILGN